MSLTSDQKRNIKLLAKGARAVMKRMHSLDISSPNNPMSATFQPEGYGSGDHTRAVGAVIGKVKHFLERGPSGQRDLGIGIRNEEHGRRLFEWRDNPNTAWLDDGNGGDGYSGCPTCGTYDRDALFDGHCPDEDKHGAGNSIASTALAIMYTRMGCCSDKNQLAYALFRQNPNIVDSKIINNTHTMLLAYSVGYDHAFTIITSKPYPNEHFDWSTTFSWRDLGKDCLVLDGWREDWYFPNLSQIEKLSLGVKHIKPNPQTIFVRQQVKSRRVGFNSADEGAIWIPLPGPEMTPANRRVMNPAWNNRGHHYVDWRMHERPSVGRPYGNIDGIDKVRNYDALVDVNTTKHWCH